MSTGRVPFWKMNGIGNEIIVADMRGRADTVMPEAVRSLDAHPATKFDQLMAVHDADRPNRDGFIRILNSDGSEAGACGNGTRCVVTWLFGESGQEKFTFETIAGRLDAKWKGDGKVTVNMGVPRFEWDQIPLAEEFADTTGIELQIGPIDAPILHTPSVMNIGNPHAIFWTENDPFDYDLERFGPLLENHPIFPECANISIARVTSPSAITLRTWERGVGITQACGSAACAATVCGSRTGRTERVVTVTLPGGVLDIEWRDDNFVTMTGGTEFEFSGEFDPVTGTWSRTVAEILQ